MDKTCGIPGCTNLTARATGRGARSIKGIELCRGCYQRIWELAKETGKSTKEIFREGIAPPHHALPRIATICAREGCNVELPKNASRNVRRTIGLLHVCRPCYQFAWQHSVRDRMSIEDAFQQMKPKNWKPEPRKAVWCCLPWCNRELVPKKSSLVSEGVHACGRCRSYLKALTLRSKYRDREWKSIANDAMKGVIAAPNELEICAMTWCSAIEKPRRRGPNSVAICNTDTMYLYQYAKRHYITFEDAFWTAPPPRLLHTRDINKS